MELSDANGVSLTPDDLREVDEILLDYLQEGRITPVYARERILDEDVRESITAQYCGQRLRRLAEHGHVRNLYDVGLYELLEDPRIEA